MKRSDSAWEILTGILILTVVYMIVRPGAPVNAAITQIGNALASIVATATQYDATTSGVKPI